MIVLSGLFPTWIHPSLTPGCAPVTSMGLMLSEPLPSARSGDRLSGASGHRRPVCGSAPQCFPAPATQDSVL